MNTAELASKIAESNGLTVVKARRVITALVDVITDATQQGEEVTLLGLGTLKIKALPGGKKMVFVQSKKLKNALNPGA